MAEEKVKTAPAAKAPAAKGKKKNAKAPVFGVVTVSDDKGNTIAWSTAGSHGFKGTKKSTPFAAQITSNKAAEKAVAMGMREVAVKVCGPGQGRETAVRAVQQAGLTVSSIKDITPIPHNGCRPPKARRV